MADVSLNVSNTTLEQLRPADFFTLYADVVVPANSTIFVLADVKMPVDGFSAALTIVSLTVVSIYQSFTDVT